MIDGDSIRLSLPALHRRAGFDLRNLGQNLRGFRFKRAFQVLIVHVRHLARLVFEIQIAQVLIDCLFALFEKRHTCFLRPSGDRLGHAEHVKQRERAQDYAAQQDHRSVSLRACSRKRFNSEAPIDGPSAGTALGCLCQARTTSTTPPTPIASTREGMIHATRLNPRAVGAASTVGPYFSTQRCRIPLSLSPLSTAPLSSALSASTS